MTEDEKDRWQEAQEDLLILLHERRVANGEIDEDDDPDDE